MTDDERHQDEKGRSVMNGQVSQQPWREWASEHRTQYARPAGAPGVERLANWSTCLIGEQVRKGLIPEEWMDATRYTGPRWDAISALGVRATTAVLDWDAFDLILGEVEDVALDIKRSLEIA